MSKREISLVNPQDKKFIDLCKEHQRFCKINHLAPETIKTYIHSNTYFMRFTGEDILCKNITQKLIDNYKLYLFDTGVKPITVNTYIHNLSTAIKYGIERGYIKRNISFRQMSVQEEIKEIYTTEELRILLKKPNIKKRGFAEYRNCTIINFLLATGVRAKELRNIKIKDVDLENDFIKLQVTKNNKARIIPISTTLKGVLIQYLEIRHNKSDDEALFCNIYGEPMERSTLQMGITNYCKKRGVEKYSLHLFRHTFATNYIKAGGNPLTLQRILGHSTLKMVNRYIQLNAKDLQTDIDKFNPLDNIVRNRIKVDK